MARGPFDPGLGARAFDKGTADAVPFVVLGEKGARGARQFATQVDCRSTSGYQRSSDPPARRTRYAGATSP